jgi:dihydropteroate synthase
MGILNVTPDSFSDGGRQRDPIAAGLAMFAEGADIVDIGGESTRPGAHPVEIAEECRRILPAVAELSRHGRVSVDTRNAGTMRAALDAGAVIVNDVSSLSHDPDAAGVVARAGCPVVLMHMRGTPLTMRDLVQYDDIAADVARELARRVAMAEAAGIARNAIAIDPGIGFAKRPIDNVALLRNLEVVARLGLPMLVGVSRKGFIGLLADEPDAMARMPGSIAAGLFACAKGASLLRVHDVAATVQAVRVWRALTASAYSDQPA